MQILEIFYCQKIMESKTQKSFIQKNMKNIYWLQLDNKLVCGDNKFSKPFKKYLGKDAAHNFINNMIKKLY